ncbi:hypothetical protein GYMLUDRAFT_240978 [Collybiopsis luxurians FD-317 M1]|nr:hypothetical protein GYMLUDRAFT_240978 [Collybiopsis luxurians FD-317 M1]
MTKSLTEVEESRVLALTESPGLMQNSLCFIDLNPIAYLPSNLNETFKDLTKDVWNIFWHLSSNTALEFISRKTYEHTSHSSALVYARVCDMRFQADSLR